MDVTGGEIFILRRDRQNLPESPRSREYTQKPAAGSRRAAGKFFYARVLGGVGKKGPLQMGKYKPVCMQLSATKACRPADADVRRASPCHGTFGDGAVSVKLCAVP